MADLKSFVVVSHDGRTGGWLVVRGRDLPHALQVFLKDHPSDRIYKIAELTPTGLEMGRLEMSTFPVD